MIVDESKKEGLTTAIRKQNTKDCDLCIGDRKFKQVQKCNYLYSIVTDKRKCNTNLKEYRNNERCFSETEPGIMVSKITLEMNKIILNFYVMFNFFILL